ncbi:phosphatidylglycerol/phosphatidylinositol transfer protein [Pyrus ussuriensis x Pyrus communis]|uniref:Phosphatidylglycerol/phosphatidylinositol transfer protein n=1 Tax=Pyrus ussuriensis x Pyrus communis TaxID=2448454 RepID=A0A5N5FU25_9ROSA|nr:phosphatidylglycerol/phosphatidylinositol transfer protein [Pyrus ussuriensis x Pyrus communis]
MLLFLSLPHFSSLAKTSRHSFPRLLQHSLLGCTHINISCLVKTLLRKMSASQITDSLNCLEILPGLVVRGKRATFSTSATTAIFSGKVVIKVYYFGVRVHTETRDFCEKLSCPVSACNFLLSHTQTLPGITLPGSYNLKMTIEDEQNQKLSCISFNFKIVLQSLVSLI